MNEHLEATDDTYKHPAQVGFVLSWVSYIVILTESLFLLIGASIAGIRFARNDDSLWITIMAYVALFVLFAILVGFEFLRATSLRAFVRGIGSVASVYPRPRERKQNIPKVLLRTSEEAMKNDWGHIRRDIVSVLKDEGIVTDEQQS